MWGYAYQHAQAMGIIESHTDNAQKVTLPNVCRVVSTEPRPGGLLDPLHPSITPSAQDYSIPTNASIADRVTGGLQKLSKCRNTNNTKDTHGNSNPARERSCAPAAQMGHRSPCLQANLVSGSANVRIEAHSGISAEVRPLPLSEIGKTSKFGDAEGKACSIFEVALRTQESTMCPACTRSPRRAQLPARKYTIFG